MNNWRLVEELESIFQDDKVYLYPSLTGKGTRKKSNHKAEIMKNLAINDDGILEKRIESNIFTLKLDEYLQVWVKNPEFPDPDKFYLADNFVEFTGKIITQLTCKAGEFDTEFEAAFSESYVGKVMFVSQDMKEYDEYMNEMIRIVSCEMNKKTKKWIPGHRYDSPTETLYYLGEFLAHKSNALMSSYLKDEDMVPVHLVTDNIKGLKKISEVFKTKLYGDMATSNNQIKILEKTPLMVDTGEKLENDLDTIDLSLSWNEILGNAIKSGGSFRQVLDVMCYNNILTTDDSYRNVSQDIKDEIKNMIRVAVDKFLLIYWNTETPINSIFNRTVKTLGEKNNIDDNVSTILGSIFEDNFLEDLNAYSPIYYETILNRLGIDIREIIKECINDCNPDDLVLSSLANYITYGDLYFTYRHLDKTSITLSTSNKDKLKNVFSLTLSSKLRDMLNEAKNNSAVVSKFVKIASYRNQELVKAVITLDDLLKYCGSNPPESLKNDIIKDKFRKVTIEFDLNKEIE